MKTRYDNLWFCPECTYIAINGDYSVLDYSYSGLKLALREASIDSGIDSLTECGGQIVPGSGEETYNEFNISPCDCCGDRAAGSRHLFEVIEE